MVRPVRLELARDGSQRRMGLRGNNHGRIARGSRIHRRQHNSQHKDDNQSEQSANALSHIRISVVIGIDILLSEIWFDCLMTAITTPEDSAQLGVLDTHPAASKTGAGGTGAGGLEEEMVFMRWGPALRDEALLSDYRRVVPIADRYPGIRELRSRKEEANTVAPALWAHL